MFGLDRHVSTKCVDTRRVHARVRTLRDGCVQTFLTYEVMSMHNFKHITPCLSHNFPQVHSKQSTTSRLFNLWTLLTMQLLTYKSVFSGMVSYDKICILRRFCKLKSCGCTSFQVGQRWNTRCDMLNVTHIHVFVSQQVCRHQSLSVWTRAWPLCGSMLVEIKHEKLDDKLHTDTSSYVKICTRTPPCKSNVLFRGTSFYI